jgi:hypothetical protein
LIDFGPLVLEKKIFFFNFQFIFNLSLISLLGRGAIMNKLESPPSKDDLCQVWLKLAIWFWRRRFLNDPTPFLHFCDFHTFEEDLTLHLKKLGYPSPNFHCIFTLAIISPCRRAIFSV